MMLKNKHNVYHSLLISYISIFLIPIVICVVFYFYCYQNIKSQTELSNRNLIETVQKTCDREFQYYQNVLLQMSYNQNANQLATRRQYSSAEDYYQTYLLHDEMKDLNVSVNRNNDYCKDNFIYLLNTDKVISASGVYYFEEYMKEMVPGQSEEIEYWTEYLSQSRFCDLISIEANADNRKPMLLFTTSIGQYFSDNVIAVAGMWLDIDCLSDCVESSSWEEGIEWLAINSHDQIICGTDDMDLQLDSDEWTEGKEATVEWQGETYIANVVASNVTDLKYILLMPKDVIVGFAGKMTRLFSIAILACIFGGYAISKYFAERNYSPLRSLLEYFGSKDRKENTNEYEYLKEMMSKVLDERSDIEKTLEQSRDNIKQFNLFKTLTMANEPPKDIFIKKQIEEKFDSGKNIVLLLHVSEEAKENEEQFIETISLKRFIVNNILAEGLGEFYELEIIDVSEDMAMIINVREDDADYRHKIQEVVEELQKFIASNFKFSVSVFASNAHEGVEGIHLSYVEACKAKEFQPLLDTDYIRYEDVSDVSVKKYNYSFEVEERIINALRKSDAEVALLSINNVLDTNFREQQGTPELLYCLLYDILGTIMRTAEELGKSVEYILSIMKVTMPLSLTKIKRSFAEIVDYICREELTESDDIHKREISTEIYEYIVANFDDFDLNISQIGLHFEMTPSYLAKIFKKQTGESLLKTINDIRVGKAMELLKQGYSVLETAEKCGFRESSNLIRIFKKCTGITPGQYRDLNK